MKSFSLRGLWLILIICLAGCGGTAALEEVTPAAVTPEIAVAATATVPAPAPSTPTAVSPESSSPLPTPTLAEAAPAETPVGAAGGPEAAGDEAAQLASQALRQQLGLNLDEVEILRVEPAEWPDSCLGLGQPHEQCARMITPGYIVSLEAQGQQYQYHVDQYLSDLRLATAPPAKIGEPVITWEQSGPPCETALIGFKGVAFGPCGGSLREGSLIDELDRPAELERFVQTYAPFEAETPAGKISFEGQGSQAAGPAEQRQIAEWARLAQLEAQGSRGGASWGLVLAWHREGGIAGFCEDVVVYITGIATVTSCKQTELQELGPVHLTPEELEQIYTWVDTVQNFEVEEKDPAVADAMTVRLLFSGSGNQDATPADREAMLALAQALFQRGEAQ